MKCSLNYSLLVGVLKDITRPFRHFINYLYTHIVKSINSKSDLSLTVTKSTFPCGLAGPQSSTTLMKNCVPEPHFFKEICTQLCFLIWYAFISFKQHWHTLQIALESLNLKANLLGRQLWTRLTVLNCSNLLQESLDLLHRHPKTHHISCLVLFRLGFHLFCFESRLESCDVTHACKHADQSSSQALLTLQKHTDDLEAWDQ